MNIPELRNIVSEIKKSLDVFNGILDIAEDQNSAPKTG